MSEPSEFDVVRGIVDEMSKRGGRWHSQFVEVDEVQNKDGEEMGTIAVQVPDSDETIVLQFVNGKLDSMWVDRC